MPEETLTASPPAKTNPKFGPKLVTSWFESVINPVLNSLATELRYLNQKNWTWQYKPGRLASIRSVREMVPLGYAPNFDQFERYHPAIREAASHHDEKVANLFVACQGLQAALMEDEELQRIVAAALVEDPSSSMVTFRPPDAVGWIAQEVINRSGDLPPHIIHSVIWNNHRDRFLAVLSRPELSEAVALVDRAGDVLIPEVELLIGMLRDTRDELSITYDVPPVPTAASMAA